MNRSKHIIIISDYYFSKTECIYETNCRNDLNHQ